MFIETIIIALVIGIIIGGGFKNLRYLSLRHIELFLLAFLIQVGLGFLTNLGISWVMEYKGMVHILSYLLLFAGLFINRNVPGIKILAGGVFLNFLVIALNQGLMPVQSEYLPPDVLEKLRRGMDGTHGLISEDTRLRWLADWIYCPLPYSSQLISVGDIVMDVGVFYLIIKAVKERGEGFKFTYINRQL